MPRAFLNSMALVKPLSSAIFQQSSISVMILCLQQSNLEAVYSSWSSMRAAVRRNSCKLVGAASNASSPSFVVSALVVIISISLPVSRFPYSTLPHTFQNLRCPACTTCRLPLFAFESDTQTPFHFVLFSRFLLFLLQLSLSYSML